MKGWCSVIVLHSFQTLTDQLPARKRRLTADSIPVSVKLDDTNSSSHLSVFQFKLSFIHDPDKVLNPSLPPVCSSFVSIFGQKCLQHTSLQFLKHTWNVQYLEFISWHTAFSYLVDMDELLQLGLQCCKVGNVVSSYQRHKIIVFWGKLLFTRHNQNNKSIDAL